MTDRPSSAGRAYLVVPDDGPGPGVLVLHSWWGLTGGIKDVVESLADEGFTALAPDLMGGEQPTDPESAAAAVHATQPDDVAGLILSSIVALRSRSDDPEAGVGVIGFSMGGSWGLWAAVRQPDSVRAVVDYYGHTDLDFADLEASVLGHFATDDALVTEDDIAEMQAHLLLVDKSVEIHRYGGARHFFAEVGVPVLDSEGRTGERSGSEEKDAAAAWARTVSFLGDELRG